MNCTRPRPLTSKHAWIRSGVVAAVFFCDVLGVFAQSQPPVPVVNGSELSLNGTWETGIDRHYDHDVVVPGLVQDPAAMSPGTLWFRRTIRLPGGDWTHAVLTLGGARFAPAVYVDGEKVSATEGGMAPTRHALASAHVQPGATINLEIALQSLSELDSRDASAVPTADRWRSDNSSGLWDAAVLHFSGAARISRLVPWTDFARDQVAVHWTLDGGTGKNRQPAIHAELLDSTGTIVATSASFDATQASGVIDLPLQHAARAWTPDSPQLYRLHVTLEEAGRLIDRCEIPWGRREFHAEGLRFVLNGEPVQLRGATVVWHRWLRDPEARSLAWDTAWFEHNIVQRLKGLGANFLRFHLGLPPEALLDQCDRDGLLVQVEWPFFHGVKASPASMSAQWRAWLDVAMRHPSVVLIHPWNETEGDELTAAWSALNAILPEYPPLVIAHRDEIPVHKYWWSLFENLGLYYDSATQFSQPILVDEFGGNYLDGRGEPGLYPSVRESLLRFLGRDATRERRLRFQAESNAKVAEYWRRLGAAGFAPFCALSSPQDGNTWFLGALAQPEPKPVWAALAAAYAPQSVSLEIWDRNFSPRQSVRLPLYFFNDGSAEQSLVAEVRIVAADGATATRQTVRETVAAHGVRVVPVTVETPAAVGEWRFEAELVDQVAKKRTESPVVSAWDFRTLGVAVPPALREIRFGVAEDELRALLAQNHLTVTALEDPNAQVLVLSAEGWSRLPASPELGATLANANRRGFAVVLLDIGPRNLGQGYSKGDLGPLEGAPRVTVPKVETDELFSGIRLTFREMAEPESHLHPAAENAELWSNLPREATWLWNGLRGGLIVPATDMEVAGLAPEALIAQWSGRGASEASLRGGGEYFAYQLGGFYAFAVAKNDSTALSQLRARVRLLAEDAPALQNRINPGAPVEIVDLGQAYRTSQQGGRATVLTPLASCGKNLVRTPIVELAFGGGRGQVVLSQVLTAGRLQRGRADPGLYGLRYDPAAEQFVLNLLARALAGGGPHR